MTTDLADKLPKLEITEYFKQSSDVFGLKFTIRPSLEFSSYN